MALKKQTTAKGFTAYYYRIRSMESNYNYGQTQVVIDLYKDKETRFENNTCYIDSFIVSLPVCESRAEAYQKLKETDLLTNSEDV